MRVRAPKDERSVWKAARRGDFGKLRGVLSAARDPAALVNCFNPATGTTPLMAAAAKRSGAPALQVLLEYGAELEARDQSKHAGTALHHAAHANRVAQIDLLLHAGASPYALNRSGHSPLDVARIRGRREAARVLTAAVAVHSGWLSIRSQAILPVWRRRWCVVQACGPDREVLELSVFQDPEHAQPEYVLQVDPPTLALPYSAEAEGHSVWMNRANAFKMNAPVRYQRIRRQRFRRNPATGRTQAYGTALSMDYVFAADSADEVDEWMRVLEGRHELFPSARGNFADVPLAVTVVPVDETYSQGVSPRVRPASFSALTPQLEDTTTSVEFPSGARRLSEPELNPKPSSPSQPSVDQLSRASAPTFLADDDYNELFPPASAPSNDSARAAGTVSESPRSTDFARPGDMACRDCVVCMDASRDAICVPCGHIAGCFLCLQAIVQASGECPICRAHVDNVVRIYDC